MREQPTDTGPDARRLFSPAPAWFKGWVRLKRGDESAGLRPLLALLFYLAFAALSAYLWRSNVLAIRQLSMTRPMSAETAALLRESVRMRQTRLWIWPASIGVYLGIAFLHFYRLRRRLARQRQRRRQDAGQCITCGYDLRGSPGCCPECGRDTDGVAQSSLG